MDIRYKSFVPRSKQDHRFDQLLQASSSLSKPNYDFTYNKSPTNTDYSNFSQKSPTIMSNNRKKVNVVTFTPDESNELVSHNRINTNCSEPNLIDSPPGDIYRMPTSNNIPSILRTSRISSAKSDNVLDSNISIVDSASKLMAAKRKAAKEVADTRSSTDESKRKYSPIITGDLSIKRAVSPEILRPEGCEHENQLSCDNSWWTPDTRVNMYLSPPENEDLQRNDMCYAEPRTVALDQPIIQRTLTRPDILMPAINDKDRIRSLSYESRPIINSKKSKVSYNPRPWQHCLDDDDSDNQFRLQSENIVYRSNSDPINTLEETPLYDFDNSDNIDCSSSNIVSLTKSNSEGSYDRSQQNRQPSYTGNSVTKNSANSERYTVLKNVKEAHECQETGETQDLLNDVDYLIEGLKDNYPATTRTLSIITLTGKCLVKSFREVLKAHGLLATIFKHLDDAYLNESVAMCTAALFLVFSRDKEPRMFDDNSLGLLLKLPRISKNQTRQSKENERVRDKIRLMLNRFHQFNSDDHKGSELDTKPLTLSSSFQRPCSCCRHLKLDNNITTEDLVVECLLQFSSRKCPDWFKSLLRKQHGLDLICDQVTSSVEYLGSDLGPQSLDEFVMDRLYRLFNYMRFFEHMTFQNRDNQSYLIDYSDAVLIETLLRCLKLCAANLSYQANCSQEKKLIQECLLANLRLLANISHDNEYTSNLLGSCSGLLKLIFSCLLHLPRFMIAGKRFDLSVLALALLINLVEHCSENRRRMAHVSISRKRVACLGRCGQILNNDINTAENNSEKSMEFSFNDELEDEDMDLEDEDDDDDPNHYANVDCESSDTKINVLEALVKLFLRHDDRAKNNTLIEGDEEEVAVEKTDNGEIYTANEKECDQKWRLVADRSVSRKNKLKRLRGYGGREKLLELSESEDDCSSEEGADVEFMISSKEEEEELQKKLSAAGQHMQDSVVSAYAALLLGCIIKSSHHYMERIRQHLPLGKFKILAFVLAKFLSILSLTTAMSHSGEESILEIVRLLEAQDQVMLMTDGDGNGDGGATVMDGRPLCLPSSGRRHSSHSPTSSSSLATGQCHPEGDHCDYDDRASVTST